MQRTESLFYRLRLNSVFIPYLAAMFTGMCFESRAVFIFAFILSLVLCAAAFVPKDPEKRYFLLRVAVGFALAGGVGSAYLAGFSLSFLPEYISDISAPAREFFISRFETLENSSFAAAITFGEKSGIPASLSESLRANGTSHLLAISGLHVSLIIAIVAFPIKGIFRAKTARAVLILFSLAFIFLSGASPSATRACLTASMIFAAFIFERRAHPATSLIFSASVIVTFSPATVISPSFLLSCLAVLAILTVASPVISEISTALFEKFPKKPALYPLEKLLLYFISSFVISVFVSAMTLPCILAFFDGAMIFPWVFNVILIPLFAPCVFFALVYFFVSFIPVPVLCGLIGKVFDFFASLFIRVSEGLSSSGVSSFALSPDAAKICAAVIAAELIFFFVCRPPARYFFGVALAAFFTIILAAIL